jgi:mRNA-degrading endonuclease toxin of MazEF toxin-antitoxin module
MPNAKRGEVWQVDFGLAAKVRPALVLGCDIADDDRVLVAVVFHTTAWRGSRYEVPIDVISTNEKLVTTVIGGLGSDTIHVMGDVTERIVSSDIC